MKCPEHKGYPSQQRQQITDGTVQQQSLPSVSDARNQNKGCNLSEALESELLRFPALGVTWFLAISSWSVFILS